MVMIAEPLQRFLTVGEVARRAECGATTVRELERAGLIVPAARLGERGDRIYGPDAVQQVKAALIIRRAGQGTEAASA